MKNGGLLQSLEALNRRLCKFSVFLSISISSPLSLNPNPNISPSPLPSRGLHWTLSSHTCCLDSGRTLTMNSPESPAWELWSWDFSVSVEYKWCKPSIYISIPTQLVIFVCISSGFCFSGDCWLIYSCYRLLPGICSLLPLLFNTELEVLARAIN